MWLAWFDERVHVRERGVGVEVYALQLEDVVFWVLAVLQRVLAGHLEFFAEGRHIDAFAEDARSSRGAACENGRGQAGEESHICSV